MIVNKTEVKLFFTFRAAWYQMSRGPVVGDQQTPLHLQCPHHFMIKLIDPPCFRGIEITFYLNLPWTIRVVCCQLSPQLGLEFNMKLISV